MRQITSRITENRRISESFYELSIEYAGAPPEPGQFITIRCGEGTSPLLPRPFAVSDFRPGELKIIYQLRGDGTKNLSKKAKGESLGIISPLGNPFPVKIGDKKPVLIGGGIGLGPILYLHKRFEELSKKPSTILGFRNASFIPADIPLSEGFSICTDDGSSGFGGTTADYLSKTENLDTKELFCCGPLPMLRACHKIALENNIRCWVSVEEIMACGVGACMGCAVKLKSGYARACSEGPVFNSRDVEWD